MVATVSVQEGTGSSVSWTTITNRVRLFASDLATNQTTAQTSSPIIIPSAAGQGYNSGNFNYSFWKHVSLSISGTFTTVSNINHYSSGSIAWTWGTSGQLRRGMINGTKGSVAQGCPVVNYTQATGTGNSGYPIEGNGSGSNGHPYYDTSPNGIADMNSDTSGSLALIDAGPYTTTTTATNSVVLQAKVGYDATQGTQTAVTLTWQYDES